MSRLNMSRPATSDFLGRMTAASRERLAADKASEPEAAVLRRASERPHGPALRRSDLGFDVIAEVKWRSPSEGSFGAQGGDATVAVQARATAYAEAGAMALSVLTEPTAFGGDLTHLEAATAAVPETPVMRKDFLVDPYQVVQARALGAAGVLLIVRCLSDEVLVEMTACALELGMFALVEAFDADDLARCHRLVASRAGESQNGHLDGLGKLLVGLNCRDLATLDVEPTRFADLIGAFPDGVLRVAESGIAEPTDAASVVRLGYDTALIGSALMRSSDPGQALRAILAAGRGAAPCASE